MSLESIIKYIEKQNILKLRDKKKYLRSKRAKYIQQLQGRGHTKSLSDAA